MRYVHRCQLRWADFDAYRHLNNVRFIELFQEARIAFAVDRLAGRGVFDSATVVARQEVDYLLPLEQRAGDVDVSVWVTRLGRSSVNLATQVLEPAYPGHAAEPEPEPGTAGPPEAPVVYARGTCVLVGWDVAARRSRRFDDQERAVFEAFLEATEPARVTPAPRA